jgi:Uma2 family endonuclease
MSLRTEATIDDLYRVRGKAELVRGEIVLMSPTGGLPGYAAGRVWRSLDTYAHCRGHGYAIGGNVGFIVDLPDRKSFCPDAAYYVGRLTMKFLSGPPEFAVEVRSEGAHGPAAEQEMADKRADYFAAGTKVVWDVDLEGPDTVRVYRAGDAERPTIYHRGQTAEAERAVPRWSMPVDDLFPPEDG